MLSGRECELLVGSMVRRLAQVGRCTNKVWYSDWSQNPNTIWVELKNLNFDKDQPVKVINPRDPSLAGEVSRSFEAVK